MTPNTDLTTAKALADQMAAASADITRIEAECAERISSAVPFCAVSCFTSIVALEGRRAVAQARYQTALDVAIVLGLRPSVMELVAISRLA
jgi:hypothetical protein